MLNRVIEKSAIKCDQYWPLEPGQLMSWDPVGLSVENVAQTPGQHYTISTLRYTTNIANVVSDSNLHNNVATMVTELYSYNLALIVCLYDSCMHNKQCFTD